MNRANEGRVKDKINESASEKSAREKKMISYFLTISSFSLRTNTRLRVTYKTINELGVFHDPRRGYARYSRESEQST